MTLVSPRAAEISAAVPMVQGAPQTAGALEAAFPDRVFPVPWVFSAMLAIFCLGVTAGDRFPGFLYVGWAGGALLGLSWCLSWLRHRPVVFPELGLFWAFVAWAAFSGMLAALDAESMWRGVYREVLVGCLFTLLGCYCASMRNPAMVFMAAVIVASILVGYSLATGDFSAAANFEEQSQRIVASRAASLTSNANGLGLQSLCGIIGLAFFWRMARSWIAKGLMLCAAPLFMAGVILSASRKTSVSLFVFLVAWGWLCYRRYLAKRWILLSIVAVLLGSGAFLAQQNWDKTFLGKRWSQVGKELDSQDSSVQTRIDLYREGLGMLVSHPFTGVGLSQFELHSTSGLYSHSEFMEVLATTGPMGFIIYFSMFGLLFLRLRRILHWAQADHVRYAARFALAVLAAFLAHAIGAPLFNSLTIWCLLPGLFGFAYAAERDLRAQARPI